MDNYYEDHVNHLDNLNQLLKYNQNNIREIYTTTYFF